MALHQDIYWLGRQWAVTGSGMQVLNRRLHGQFDIDVIRLWDADLPEQVGGHPWLNVDDFRKGLEIARAQFPGTPQQVALVADAEIRRSAAKAAPPEPVVAPPKPSIDAPKQPLPPVARPFILRAEGWPAKLVAMWRVRVRLKGDQP